MSCFLFLFSDSDYLAAIGADPVCVNSLRKPSFSHDLHSLALASSLLEEGNHTFVLNEMCLKNIWDNIYSDSYSPVLPLYELTLSINEDLEILEHSLDFRDYFSAIDIVVCPYPNFWSNPDSIPPSNFVRMIKNGFITANSCSSNISCTVGRISPPHLTCLMAGPYYLEMPDMFSNGEFYEYMLSFIHVWDSIIVCNDRQKELLSIIAAFLFRKDITHKIFVIFSLTSYTIRKYLEADESSVGDSADCQAIQQFVGKTSLPILMCGGFYTWTKSKEVLFELVKYISMRKDSTRLKLIIPGFFPPNTCDIKELNVIQEINNFLQDYDDIFANSIDQISSSTKILYLDWSHATHINCFLHNISIAGFDYCDDNSLEAYLRQRVRSTYFEAFSMAIIVNSLDNIVLSDLFAKTPILLEKNSLAAFADNLATTLNIGKLENDLAKYRLKTLSPHHSIFTKSNKDIHNVINLRLYLSHADLGCCSIEEEIFDSYPDTMFSHQDHLRSLEISNLLMSQYGKKELKNKIFDI